MTHTIPNKMARSHGIIAPIKKSAWPCTVLQPWKRCARPQRSSSSTPTGVARIKGAVAAIARHGWPFRRYLICLPCPTWWTQTAGCGSTMACIWCARSAATAPCASSLASYYVGRALAGQHVALHLSAAKRALLVVHGHQVIKTLPLKGLWGKALRFEVFVQLMMGQARAEHRLRSAQERRARLGGYASS